MVAEVMTTHALSQRRACELIGITRRGFQRAPAPDRNLHLRQRLRELAEERRRWGCPMLYVMLRREGWRANHKRVERLYREEGLSLRRRRRKRLSHLRVLRERPVAANQTWAVDFIHDSLISGRRFRAFAVLDEWSRESLAIEVDVSLSGERVTRVLERLRSVRGLPTVIQADNGPELRGRVLDQWATTMACGCSSSNQASRSRMRTSRASMHGCARNVSTNTSLCHSTMRATRSKSGESHTIANVPIRALAT
jgi:putative transposase